MVIKIVREFLEAPLGIGGFCTRLFDTYIYIYIFFNTNNFFIEDDFKNGSLYPILEIFFNISNKIGRKR